MHQSVFRQIREFTKQTHAELPETNKNLIGELSFIFVFVHSLQDGFTLNIHSHLAPYLVSTNSWGIILALYLQNAPLCSPALAHYVSNISHSLLKIVLRNSPL